MNRSKTLCAKCFVPTCGNTTTNSLQKVFVLLNENVKRQFCLEANVDYRPEVRMFCCEDHLNLKEDLENYHTFQIKRRRPVLKSTAKLRLTENVPPDPHTQEVNETAEMENSMLRAMLLQPIENLPIKCASNTKPCSSSNKPTTISSSTHPIKVDASTQYFIKMVDERTSTKGLLQCYEDSPVLSSQTSTVSTNDENWSPSFSGCTSTTDTESTTVLIKDSPRDQILNFIYNEPKSYIGLPKSYLWLVKYIVLQSVTKITELDIIITLLKIKLNDPVHRICDHFQISRVTFSKSFHAGITVLASFFQNLIHFPSLLQIKQNQPLAFKIRYSNIVLLLDAFEIEIQKPHNAMAQAQTWSQYKNANTVKYLVGSTPNGYISFVSSGYGGRISDKALVEKSNLIDQLPDNAVIMADRGFKEIEALLSTKNIKLKRPPSVFTSNKPTKEEVQQTKVIASLRVHIERVIRRIREFSFLKAHSVVNHKHVGYLDHIVLIACGLINLQDEIIKCE